MWKVSLKTPHTQLLCRVQFYKLPLKTNRGEDLLTSQNVSKPTDLIEINEIEINFWSKFFGQKITILARSARCDLAKLIYYFYFGHCGWKFVKFGWEKSQKS